MKHKIADLEGALLDAAVAQAEGRQFWLTTRPVPACWSMTDDEATAAVAGTFFGGPPLWRPSSAWSDGGPIIEREGLETLFNRGDHVWCARQFTIGTYVTAYGPTPLIAGMRAYVASKLGEEIDL